MKFRPAAALAHPSWLVALGVLGLNDHVWKRGTFFPHVVTGKLSDFAGLFVAPVLLAVLACASSKRAIAICHFAVAIGFALVKTWAPATHAFDALLSLFIPSKGVTDPTDLMALPMVWLSWRVLVPRMHGDAKKLMVIVGCALCIASEPEDNPLQFSIVNNSGQPLYASVSEVAEGVTVDCAHVSSRLFTGVLFDGQPRQKLGNEGRRTVPNKNAFGCRALWIEADLLPPALLFVPEIQYGGSVELSIQRKGDHLEWSKTSGFLTLDPQPPSDDNPRCALPDEKQSTWTTLPHGDWNVEATPDGDCLQVTLWPESGLERLWHLCIPEGSWPFQDGDRVHIDGRDASDSRLLKIIGDKALLVAARGSLLPAADDEVPFVAGLHGSSCAGVTDECGSAILNQQLSAWGKTASPGQKIAGPNGETLYVTQASERPLLVSGCSEGARSGDDFGYVLVRPTSP